MIDGNREREDPQIAADREVLDVVALDGEALLEAQLAAAEDLHRAGEARLDGQPEQVLRAVEPDELGLLGPGADEAHVAAEDVQELGELVEARPAQQASEPGHPRIRVELEHRFVELLERHELGQQSLRVRTHRSELEHLELAPRESHPRLHVERRPRPAQPDRGEDHREERQCQDEHRSGDQDVQDTLEQEGRAGDVPGVVLDHRQVGDVVELHRGAKDAARRGHDAELDVLAPAGRDELGDQRLVDRVERDDHAVGRPEPPTTVVERRADRRILVDDHRVDVGEELELAADGLREPIASHDEHAFARRDPPPQ